MAESQSVDERAVSASSATGALSGVESVREYSDEDLDRAILWAVEAFSGKCDRQGKPAILHALRVMLAGKNNAERIVGVLHDVLEDTNTRVSDLLYDFDEDLVEAIELLTRQKTSTTTYAQYIARLAFYPLARAVKLNDLADNIARAHELPEAEARSLTRRYRNAQFTLGANLPDKPIGTESAR